MLTFNPKTQSYVLVSEDKATAKAAGLTLSTKAKGNKGECVWYTADADKKGAINPYAVLDWYDDADPDTKMRLCNFKVDYDDSWAVESNFYVPVPHRVNPRTKEPYSLMPFQRAGVEYAFKRGNTLIGDVPGLGKTVQAIGLANLVEAQRVLVVCPASMRTHWQSFAREWSTIRNVGTYPIMKAADGVHPLANYVIISYDLIRNPTMQKLLASLKWDLIIMDEGHYVKTVDARRTQALFGTGQYHKTGGIVQNAKRLVALTGTPLLNRPRECYTLSRYLNWEAIDFLSEDAFKQRYNPSNVFGELVGRLPELRARLRCNFMVRRHKEDVLKDLPDKQYEMVHIEPNGAIKSVLAKERLLDFDPSSLFGGGNFVIDADNPISTVRREMGEAKVPRIIEHMRYLMEIVELPKVVLFAHHRSVMDALAESLASFGVVMYRGGMSPKAKDAAKAAFIDDPRVRIFLGQIDSSGIGLDGLQHVASHVVFGEPAWTPGANEQAADRCHRMGQHDNVIVQFLIVEGSFDELVLEHMLGKVHIIDEALDGLAA